MTGLFWLSAAVVAQTYVLFPFLAVVRARVRPREVQTADITPSVSVVIAAHNEAASIGAKVASVLDGDYPPELLDITVASDGSTDATTEAAAVDPRVRVLDLPRVGKAVALNEAIAATAGDVVVFTDANSRFESDAIRQLVRPLADPTVGAVAGDQRYEDDDSSHEPGTARGERQYWDLDRLLKQAESDGGNVIGATGALYAVRRSLVTTIPDGVTDDFTTSTGVIEQGRRLVFSPVARVYEPVAQTTDAEFARKVRVMTRGLRAVVHRRRLLDPRRHGFYSYQLINHKVLRRLMGIPLVVLFASSAISARRRPFYRLALAGQVAVYAPGLVAVVRPDGRVGRSRFGGLAAYFCLVNGAGLVAAWKVVTGQRVDRWEPDRGSTS